MADLLFKIGDVVVYVNCFAFVIYACIGGRNQSLLWSLVTLCFFNFLMQSIGVYLKDNHNSFNSEIFRHIWYLTFVFIDLVAVLFIFFVHRNNGIESSKFAVFIAGSFAFLAAVNTIRYISYVLLNVDHFLIKEFYTYSIPYINICVAITTLFVTMKSVVHKRSLE
ncbi:hypothetical protein N473_01495 [Pseudoalteromonas luteoviolacea CPMOR-1]|uniref:Uncharacterized protein n=1 Tax=Pseudoalteromonas luteoviolacea CPMOR-1 TaxID=1365248 RepID=A0A161Z951_9GAMM|nr:hypothetical protein N473_01495 [Pseudoalteromonas luteoviolacea CPMOR-1]